MGPGKGLTYFERINVDRVDLVYAQAKGHNEQQGFPGWAARRGALTLVRRVQSVRGTLPHCIGTQGKDTTHFFWKDKTRELGQGVSSHRRYAQGDAMGLLISWPGAPPPLPPEASLPHLPQEAQAAPPALTSFWHLSAHLLPDIRGSLRKSYFSTSPQGPLRQGPYLSVSLTPWWRA